MLDNDWTGNKRKERKGKMKKRERFGGVER